VGGGKWTGGDEFIDVEVFDLEARLAVSFRWEQHWLWNRELWFC
jgi:hypothetical protein